MSKTSNPQLEDGYTRIANEILDHLCTVKLNSTQHRIILLIWRFTYGFGNKERELSEGFIAKKIGANPKQVGRELNELIKRNIVLVVSKSGFNKPRVLGFNKSYTKWHTVSTNQLTGNNTVDTPLNSRQGGYSLVDLGGSESVDHIKKDIKENITPIVPLGDESESIGENLTVKTAGGTGQPVNHSKTRFEEFWKAYPRKAGKVKAETVFSKIKLSDELFGKILLALEVAKKSEQWQTMRFIPHPTTWLNQRRWEDEEFEDTEPSCEEFTPVYVSRPEDDHPIVFTLDMDWRDLVD